MGKPTWLYKEQRRNNIDNLLVLGILGKEDDRSSYSSDENSDFPLAIALDVLGRAASSLPEVFSWVIDFRILLLDDMRLVDLFQIVAVSAIVYADPSLASVLTSAGKDLSNYTIRFVEGEKLRGGVIISDGLVIPESDSFYSIKVDSFCKCRMACMTLASCLSASSAPFEGKFLCRLSEKSPVNTDLKILGNATYFFFTSSIENIFYRIMSDGFLYLHAGKWDLFNNALTYCKQMPGHRLGMYDTPPQVEAIMKILQLMPAYFPRAWTNQEASGKKLYIEKTGKFSNGFPNAQVVCQANPFGLK
ncbi:uncharacterized protein [Palaemon carinicauda]|uniref:uncharacterized protein n=1 Tax=Palaemon carinicauda TaxID=392227 RepID=UPI0035B683A6